jgi:hypothetical protein
MVADLILPETVKKSLSVLDEVTFPFFLGMPVYNLPRWKLYETTGNVYTVCIEGLSSGAARNIQTAFHDAKISSQLDPANKRLIVPLPMQGLDERFSEKFQAAVRERPGLIPYVGDRLRALNNLDTRSRSHFGGRGQRQNLWEYRTSSLGPSSSPEPHFRLATDEPIADYDQNPEHSQIRRRQKIYAAAGIATDIAGNRYGQACLIVRGNENMDAIINAAPPVGNSAAVGHNAADRPDHTGPRTPLGVLRT